MISPIRKLDSEQFKATFAHRMKQVGPDLHAMMELRLLLPTFLPEYVQGFPFDNPSLEYVQRGDTGLFEHYVMRTPAANVFLVLVLDRVSQQFYGYHLLDCNTEHGPDFPYSYGVEAV